MVKADGGGGACVSVLSIHHVTSRLKTSES